MTGSIEIVTIKDREKRRGRTAASRRSSAHRETDKRKRKGEPGMATGVSALVQQIQNGEYDEAFRMLYGKEAVAAQRERYCRAAEEFGSLFGMEREVLLFSAPGRTEIGGNHTDHNHGRVLAASVNLDVIAVASPSAEGRIRVKSEGYPMDTVSLEDLSVQEEEFGRSSALIRGMAGRFIGQGFSAGGFDAYTTSNVLKGSGLSSSAAFEVLTGTILNHLFNGGRVSAVAIAQMAQYAENVHFGKPCGLMDQMASSVGGIITIDFADPAEPIIHQVPFDFRRSGYHLCIVDTGGNHADLTPEYAAVPAEMKAVAASLGVAFLRETDWQTLRKALPSLRKQHGDRAVLRAMHFLKENDRVAAQVAALENGEFSRFLELILASGHSSFEYLQNVYPCSLPNEQGLSLALCLAQSLLEGKGAWRVHGGGFAGTTQNFVPDALLEEFRREMEAVFGEGSCYVLNIRPCGGVRLDTLL